MWSLEATLQARASLQVRRFKTPHCILLFFSAAGFATLRLLCSRFRHAATTAKTVTRSAIFVRRANLIDTTPTHQVRRVRLRAHRATRHACLRQACLRHACLRLPPPRLPARCLPRHHRLIARRIRTREACRPANTRLGPHPLHARPGLDGPRLHPACLHDPSRLPDACPPCSPHRRIASRR